MKTVEMPRPETLSAHEARELFASIIACQPKGPEVGEIEHGALPGDEDELEYRLYRPKSVGPHGIIVYFHGGGWVLGSLESDDPFCRDLCVRSNAIVISIDYRLAPEFPFPAAPKDAFAATKWVANHAKKLGGIEGKIAVAGWSAGANLAAVVCHLARDLNGPKISGQLLITPMVDCDLSRPSYEHNGEGYVLTTPLIHWFWQHYANSEDRENPQASVIRANNLADLPPCFIATCEFDPLSDEGQAYAEALIKNGVAVTHRHYAGHIHGSLLAVDSLKSGVAARAELALAIASFFANQQPSSKNN